MNAQLRAMPIATTDDADARLQVFDWAGIAEDLDAQGCAMIERLLSPQECGALAGLYADERLFRSRVVMARHGFGRGEYKYFAYPLPDAVAGLRERALSAAGADRQPLE